jgi:hypothetical protein
MGHDLYDVVVVGAAEPTPDGDARLAATLAQSHGLPVASVVRGMAAKNLCVGEGLGREAAIALVKKLGASGALTSIRKTEASLPEALPEVKVPRTTHPTPVHGNALTDGHTLQGVGALGLPLPGPMRTASTTPAPTRLAPLGNAARTVAAGNARAAGTVPAPVRSAATANQRDAGNTPTPIRARNSGSQRAGGNTPTPVRTANTGTFRAAGNAAPTRTGNSGSDRAAAVAARTAAAPPGTGNAGSFRLSTPVSSPALRPLGAIHAEHAPRAPTPIALPLDDSGSISLSYDSPEANSSFGVGELPKSAEARDPFTLPEQHDTPLELVTDTPGTSISAPAPITLAGADALETSKIVNTSASSGLRLHDQEASSDDERCPTHGVLFDRRTSTACAKCQEEKAGKRNAGSAARGSTRTRRARARLGDNPARRAFMGLFLALALGFLPAALYALKPAAGETARLRAEQADLSSRAGTEQNLRRFDEIDGLVDASHSKAMRNTLIIWVLVGGAVMGAFYKVTA